MKTHTIQHYDTLAQHTYTYKSYHIHHRKLKATWRLFFSIFSLFLFYIYAAAFMPTQCGVICMNVRVLFLFNDFRADTTAYNFAGVHKSRVRKRVRNTAKLRKARHQQHEPHKVQLKNKNNNHNEQNRKKNNKNKIKPLLSQICFSS